MLLAIVRDGLAACRTAAERRTGEAFGGAYVFAGIVDWNLSFLGLVAGPVTRRSPEVTPTTVVMLKIVLFVAP
jgi:hypothetical protein